MALGSNNPYPSVLVVEGTVPANPASGNQRVYIDSADHKFKRVNSSGTVVIIEGGGGSSNLTVATKTTAYTLVNGTDQVVLGDATGGTFALTLPTAVGNTGQVFQLTKKDTASNVVTVNTTSAQTIGGVTSKTLRIRNDSLTVVSDGANWALRDQSMSDVVQLDFVTSTDLFTNTAFTVSTWTDVVANQNFTVDDADSVIEITVYGMLRFNLSSAGAMTATRIVVNSAGTPINKVVAGAMNATPTTAVNALAGSGIAALTGVPVGTNTVKVQLQPTLEAAQVYLRSSTYPLGEFVGIRILERKN